MFVPVRKGVYRRSPLDRLPRCKFHHRHSKPRHTLCFQSNIYRWIGSFLQFHSKFVNYRTEPFHIGQRIRYSDILDRLNSSRYRSEFSVRYNLPLLAHRHHLCIVRCRYSRCYRIVSQNFHTFDPQCNHLRCISLQSRIRHQKYSLSQQRMLLLCSRQNCRS